MQPPLYHVIICVGNFSQYFCRALWSVLDRLRVDLEKEEEELSELIQRARFQKGTGEKTPEEGDDGDKGRQDSAKANSDIGDICDAMMLFKLPPSHWG